MMKSFGNVAAIAVAGTVWLTACAPLQQAPLVYSSKVVVGIDVSTNTTENPGASINLGVKTIDAAYVPVAVSKAVDERSKRNDEGTLDIKPIYAKYGQGSTQDSPDKLTEDNKRKISAYLDAKQAESSAQDLVSKADAKVKDTSALIAAIDDTQSAIAVAQKVPVSPADQTAAAAVGSVPQQNERDKRVADINEKYIKTLNDKQLTISKLSPVAGGSYNFDVVTQQLTTEKAALVTKRDAATTELSQLSAAREDKRKTAEQLFSEAAKAARLLQTDKTDALSVYGRFDSNGSASVGVSSGNSNMPSASGASLVGKVFSTGLASQNLTEAVKLEAKTKCITSMVDLARVLKEEDRKAFADKISTMCAPLVDIAQERGR